MHKIKYFVGGDMKFLAIVCGIGAVSSNHSCIWCKCPSSDRWNMEKDWSTFDSSKGARTVAEIESFSRKSKAQRMGCVGCPLFKFVPIDQ